MINTCMDNIRKLMETIEQLNEWGWEDDRVDVSEFMGKTFTEISGKQGSDELVFKTIDGEVYGMVHLQDCCESVWLEEVIGDLDDLIGSPIIEAEEAVSRKEDPPNRYMPDPEDEWDYGPESYTWTFYKLGTAKGHVTLRWYGTSNGYYGESVDIYKKGTVH